MQTTSVSPATGHSGNPALSDKFVESQLLPAAAAPRTMSVAGIGIKTFVLLGFVFAGGAYGWASATKEVPPALGEGYADTTVVIPGGFWLASFAALFLGIFIAVAPQRARILGILYALCQGYCLGAISASFNAQTDGIVSAAVLSTACVFLVALFLYVTRIIKPSQKMAFGVSAALGGLCMLYFFVFVLSIFDWGWLYSESFRTVGLIVTLLAIVLAALCLVLDFGTIERGVDAGAPKELEWYLAFSLMVTLIWLYVMILRLLAVLSRNR